MNYKLNSNKLFVLVSSKGAEITSVIFNEQEYMWQAKPEVWPRHAPVLFPIVGKLKSGALSQHGFARDMEFVCIENSETRIKFELRDNEQTNTIFPYEFVLHISYELEHDAVICTYEVKNPSAHDLFFSIGAHPGFCTPEGLENYKLRFETKENLVRTKLQEGFLSSDKEKFELENGELKLSTALFDTDALVFEDSQINSLQLVSTKSVRGVELNCAGWPYFGIWSKKYSNEFVCLEPWYGITDSVNATDDLSNKKGIIKLEPERNFKCSFRMRFF